VPIVGVGASAGGLEAFTQLLKRLPVDTGFGFVLVQHLDPQHESALTQLLARATTMPVREVTNNLRVEANRVYIIPPNTRLGIAHGVLKLQPRSNDRVAARSIDFFFEALARDQRERAIGVILSGSATDGTLGLEAIKAEGGLTFAQDDSARYDSMPRSAVAAGCVDFVLSPENIAKEMARIARHPYVAGRAPASQTPVSARGRIASKINGRSRGFLAPGAEPAGRHEQNGYQKILLLLRNHCGVDFSLYKSATIHRRITRRTVLNQQATLAHYADFLRGNPKELDALYSDALISVTSFFRNAEAFDVLRHKIFPQLLQQRSAEPLRVWVLGCSTGQEAYSIAIAFAEAAEKFPRARKLQVFATDLNEANLDKARHGFYAKSLAQDVSPERLRRFFTEEEGGYRVIKPLRELVVFARQNVISDPPFSRMDLISCRNLMIYLEPSLHKKVLPTFHYALKPGGFLFLGAAESIGTFTDLFNPVDKKQKLFAKKAAPTVAFQLPVRAVRGKPASPGQKPRPALSPGQKPDGMSDIFRGELSAEREADRVTINQFAPPSVLIDADLQILQFRGPTGAYLESPTGRPSFDLLNMAREGLMLPLRAAIKRAKKENKTARTENVPVVQNGITRAVHVEIVPLKNLKERRYLVLFEEAEKRGSVRSLEQPDGAERPPRPLSKREESSRVAALARALAETRDYLQSIQEQYEAANEELQAANEEGQSANEELQSLNEELETSKEELESTNEELTTVNEEMVHRNTELNQLNSDLINFQTSTKLVIVLLGRDLTIRRFSAQAGKQFHLLATDVGRPIGGIRHNLAVSDLETFVSEVIATVREVEREVQDRDGRWYSLRVRPYVTLDNKVDGAVLVLMDIDDLKRTERLITEAHEHAEAIIRTVPNPLVILTADLRIQSSNDAFNRTFKVLPKAVKGRSIFEIGHGSWNLPRLRRLLEGIIPRNSFFDDFEVTHDFEKIGRRSLLLNARMLNESGGRPKVILLGLHDITLRKRAEEALAEARVKLDAYAGQLEKLVAARTAELTATNQRLETSIASLETSKEQYRTLLVEAQMMQKRLRQLTHQIITAQEEERKQISRELHDEVVQMLVGINVELSALGRASSVGVPNLREKIVHTQRLVENSVNAVHRFARDLRPAVLDDLGLIPALHAHCKSLAARKKLKIHLTAFGGVEALDGPERTVLFRVAQEALTNVARHAHATQVRMSITEIPGAIRMEICDNGRSFPVTKILLAKNNKRLGLIGMRERVEMVGGSLTIESAPGQGTAVRAEIPFNQEHTRK
jgi:two-component system CheB/CheR fusion protein